MERKQYRKGCGVGVEESGRGVDKDIYIVERNNLVRVERGREAKVNKSLPHN